MAAGRKQFGGKERGQVFSYKYLLKQTKLVSL